MEFFTQKRVREYIPLNGLNLLQRFSILSFIPILIVVAILGSLVSYFIMNSMIKEASDHSKVHIRIFAEKFLTSEDFDADYPLEEKNFDTALTPILTSLSEYKRIKVYDKNGMVLWSDKKELIDMNFYDSNKELRKALDGKVVAKFGKTKKEENIYEKIFGKTLEVYVPIIKEDGIVGVIEVYRKPTVLLDNINRALILIWSISILGGILIYFSLFWIVKSSYNQQLILEKKIFESKNRLENLIDGMKDGIALTDSNCNILALNKSLAERFNIPIQEAVGEDISKYVFKNSKGDNVPVCNKNRCNKERMKTIDFELYDEKSNKKSYFKLNCFPIMGIGEDGSIKNKKEYQSVVFLQDVTKERELTEELIVSEKLATIGTLFPKISHEIKSPLNALELGLVTMQEKYPNESVVDLLLNSKDNLLRISNDLLAFSRISEERFIVLNLNDVLKRSVKFLRDTTGQIKYHKIVEEYQDVPKIKGIFGQLEQLFINLILNASQAMEYLPLSEQVLTIGSYEEDDIVVAFVKDCGTGIRSEYYDKIFDPFFTTKEEGKGTGLGITIVQEIATRHKSSVSFVSEEGKGSIFFIKFHKADTIKKTEQVIPPAP
jgi:signal transduction histidine kinase